MAERLFKGKKGLYPHSVRDMFVNSRLAAHHETMYKNLFNGTINPENEKTQVITNGIFLFNIDVSTVFIWKYIFIAIVGLAFVLDG